MDLGTVVRELYNGITDLLLIVSEVWDWLLDDHLLGFSLPLIGDIGFTIVPIQVIGVGFIGVMVFWLLKALVPVA